MKFSPIAPELAFLYLRKLRVLSICSYIRISALYLAGITSFLYTLSKSECFSRIVNPWFPYFNNLSFEGVLLGYILNFILSITALVFSDNVGGVFESDCCWGLRNVGVSLLDDELILLSSWLNGILSSEPTFFFYTVPLDLPSFFWRTFLTRFYVYNDKLPSTIFVGLFSLMTDLFSIYFESFLFSTFDFPLI